MRRPSKKLSSTLITSLIIIAVIGAIATLRVSGKNAAPNPGNPRTLSGIIQGPRAVATSMLGVSAQGPIADKQAVVTSLAEKQAIEQQYERERQDALKGPPETKNLDYIPPTPGHLPTPTPMLGFVDNWALPAGWGSVYHFENGWRGIVNGKIIGVLAGVVSDMPHAAMRITNPPGQGILIIRDPDAPGGTDPYEEYQTPSRSGPVRIIEAQGTEVTISSTVTGERFVFDLITRRWK